MNFTLRDIDYFLAVAKAGRLAQAAEACGVTQPALTKAIQRLEAEFGLKLFERNARGTRLTSAGLRFLEVAQGLSAGYGDAVRLASEMRAQQAGLLRIGVTDTTRASLITPTLAPLIRQRPGLRVALRVGRSDQLARAVRDGDLDMALVPAYEDQSFDCERIKVGSDPLHPVVRAGHALAQRSRLSLADLVPYGWVLSGPNTAAYRAVSAVFSRLRLPPPVVAVETEYSSEAGLALVRSTDLLAMAPQSLLRVSAQSDLHILPLAQLKLTRAVVLLTRTGAACSPLMDAFRDALVASAARQAAAAHRG